jgi:hypothetical protein
VVIRDCEVLELGYEKLASGWVAAGPACSSAFSSHMHTVLFTYLAYKKYPLHSTGSCKYTCVSLVHSHTSHFQDTLLSCTRQFLKKKEKRLILLTQNVFIKCFFHRFVIYFSTSFSFWQVNIHCPSVNTIRISIVQNQSFGSNFRK